MVGLLVCCVDMNLSQVADVRRVTRYVEVLNVLSHELELLKIPKQWLMTLYVLSIDYNLVLLYDTSNRGL